MTDAEFDKFFSWYRNSQQKEFRRGLVSMLITKINQQRKQLQKQQAKINDLKTEIKDLGSEFTQFEHDIDRLVLHQISEVLTKEQISALLNL